MHVFTQTLPCTVRHTFIVRMSVQYLITYPVRQVDVSADKLNFWSTWTSYSVNFEPYIYSVRGCMRASVFAIDYVCDRTSLDRPPLLSSNSGLSRQVVSHSRSINTEKGNGPRGWLSKRVVVQDSGRLKQASELGSI